MSKVASYLQGHVFGELTTRKDIRESVQHDGSVLERTPEMVVYPRTGNDIRKVLRFAWQLAEKGHALPVTARGYGTDSTGSAIGSGISLVVSRYMNRIFQFDSKQKLVRLQPGASVTSVINALRLQGATIPPIVGGQGTVGGEVMTNHMHPHALKYGRVGEWIDKLEIILDNGDVIQTGKVNKRDVNKRKGWQGREGDIYRGVDAILDDHAQLIASMRSGEVEVQGGYPGIMDVRGKDGSLDLTPLFVGSQGTLGIISEMILRAIFVPSEISQGVIAFPNAEKARDVVGELARLNPLYVEYYDGRLLTHAISQGNTYEWLGAVQGVGAVVTFALDDFNERARQRQLKKAIKLVQKHDDTAIIATSASHDADALESIRAIIDVAALPPLHADRSGPLLVDGFNVPPQRLEEFLTALATLEDTLHVELPLYGSPVTGHFSVRPTLSLQKVSDKQKVFKLIDQLNAILISVNGQLVPGPNEGRLLSRFVRAGWSEEYTQMVDEIRRVFDPHGVLNPEVKAATELRDLVAHLRSDNAIGVS